MSVAKLKRLIQSFMRILDKNYLKSSPSSKNHFELRFQCQVSVVMRFLLGFRFQLFSIPILVRFQFQEFMIMNPITILTPTINRIIQLLNHCSQNTIPIRWNLPISLIPDRLYSPRRTGSGQIKYKYTLHKCDEIVVVVVTIVR